MPDWREEVSAWLAPFVAWLDQKARRRMCPLYVVGRIGPGERKSVGPMAQRVAPGHYDRLHHFVSDGLWDEAPLERKLAIHADNLVGGADAFLWPFSALGGGRSEEASGIRAVDSRTQNSGSISAVCAGSSAPFNNNSIAGTVRNFVCGPGIVGTKEISHGPTQRACDT